MRTRPLAIGLVAAAAVAVPAVAGTAGSVPAGIADFSPDPIEVSPGQTVTWTWAGGGLTHNVTAQSGPAVFASPTQSDGQFQATFEYSGEVTYVCTVHGPPMEARVVVDGASVNTPPVASFTITPNPATTGQAVQFDAGGTTDPDGDAIVRYRWDFDADGTYDTTTSTPTISRTFSTPGDRAVTVEAMDAGRGIDQSDARTLTVTGPVTAPPPPPAGGGPPPPPAGSSDTKAPVFTRLSVVPRRFCARRSRRCRRPGARLRFTLSEAATVEADVFLLAVARSSKRRVRQLRIDGRRGTQTVRFSGARLRPGRYAVSATAVDAARNRSRALTASFTVRR